MIQDLSQRVREAFLAHRLNRAELVRVAEAGEEAAPVFDRFTDPALDLREPVDPERFRSALAQFGLARQFAALDPDQPWSPYERALYRRLSLPDFDPAEEAPPTERTRGSRDLVATVQARFEDWDRDHDTRLTVAEIDRAMADPGSTPDEAAALAVLRTFPEALGSCVPSDGEGVTLRDLAHFAGQGLPGAELINRDFEGLREQAWNLGPSTPPVRPDPMDIRQGRLGSCVLLSTAAGMTNGELVGLVQESGDGSATVRFRDGQDETVYSLTPAERLFHATASEGSPWPGLLEVAMGQRLARKVRPGDGSARSAADGVPPAEAMEALTGRPAREVSLEDLSLNATRRLLREVCGRPGPRVCGTRRRPLLRGRQFDVESLHNGIPNTHAYTLLGYDEASDTVRLRNPHRQGAWAGATGESGVFEMPAAQFYCSFRWVASPEP